jgi:hypothetical protein
MVVYDKQGVPHTSYQPSFHLGFSGFMQFAIVIWQAMLAIRV